ncbi:MAG: VWA domain-containing protein [Solirubrobacteraceae bacterium]
MVGVRAQQPARPEPQSPDAFRFKSGVDLVNVTATVSDENGRFVPGLRESDFTVYEDDRPQAITQFSAERVPVSLGIALDTSGSMAGDKIDAAQGALNRFLYDLLDKDDEIFLYRFSDEPVLLQGWTKDRQLLSHALGRITPSGGTAMYDTIVEAVPLAQTGEHRKKALVIISDGNDTSSNAGVRAVKDLIRESEVLVYAIGIDGDGGPTARGARVPRVPIPFPFPPGRGRGYPLPPPQQPPTGWARRGQGEDRVNAEALREMTDDSGGRTEIIRDARDLDPATAYIADELSKQYYLGYAAQGKHDGRWHSIRVEVHNPAYRVRARKGYVAS